MVYPVQDILIKILLVMLKLDLIRYIFYTLSLMSQSHSVVLYQIMIAHDYLCCLPTSHMVLLSIMIPVSILMMYPILSEIHSNIHSIHN
jgi:hypothetical protein